MTDPRVVCANDWGTLHPPALGRWEPSLSVSVVVPAYRPTRLAAVLAGLAAQSYPAHLLEVVVVDDGSPEPVTLPEVRPERTRLLRTPDGWGRAAACQHGADHGEGDVVHWLDADMVPCREEVEAQLRWHHLVDYAVVLGDKSFADEDALEHLAPEALRASIAAGQSPDDLAVGATTPHEWVERILGATRELRDAGPRAMRLHTGASASVGRDLLRRSGGMPVGLALGEDIVLGYRLREAGAVFVPDREAHSLHLGRTAVMQAERAVNDYNRPFIRDLVPEFRGHRTTLHRSYAVPYLEVVLPVDAGSDPDRVGLAVDQLLGDPVPDLVVTLVGPWSSLPSGRRSVLADDALALRMVEAQYGSEPRVRLHDEPTDRCEATFRLTLPGPDRLPAGKALQRLLHGAEKDHLGSVFVGDDIRLVRTAAQERARLLAGDGARLDTLLRAVYPTADLSDDEAGLVPVSTVVAPRRLRGVATWSARPGASEDRPPDLDPLESP